MKRRTLHAWTSFVLVALLLFPQTLPAQQDKVAALTESLAANQKELRQYKWVETSVMSLKGEEKSRVQKQCFYGADGKIQKTQLSAPPPEEPAPGGLKGKAIAKKRAELTATMNQTMALIQSYVPPDSKRIQATKAAGNLAINPLGPNSVRLDLRSYLKTGDTFSLGLDTGSNALQTISVKSYLTKEKDDPVTLDVTFARLRDGLSYPGNIVLSVPEEKIQVVIQNSNYQRIAPATPVPAQPGATAAGKPTATSASTAALDHLLAPIALYPDALVAQILEGSKDFAAVQKFAGWLKSNSALKGTELQDAAHKAGFATCYVALAPFPQVVQMLAEKPDWTKPLGAAFTSDQAAVYQSIQRLRAAAMALGNLKTTPQQEVVTETASTGQTIILVQPANPQVVYVPVYNTQVVYVQQAPPPPPSSSSSNVAAAAMIGFTAGVIIASSSNNYYYGPYAWRGGGAYYNQAYERREDYVDQRQDYAEDRRENAQDNQGQRQQNAQSNQSQRQSTSQANQSTRQSTADANQSTRQSTAQTNQSTRQSTASSGSGGSGETAQANQANRQSTAQTNSSSRQSTGQANQSSRQSTAQSGGGYQSGATARSQSARGSGSRGTKRGR